ncbi:hypothetical protein QEZ54_19270 [Catellatospora sp. KI3]|uniref:hypothetical protein n=1 Tax=Catellatospora sp. KI3 TaxID=3041620 RepID=UPI002482E446|nr:hypothetical protein [Catellatospora sp. KI3]MDI1463123.1 hypothetical protein [Catellatospora sp. KI3]
MNSPNEPELKAALQRLSDVAGPADLSDAALRGARSRRRVRGAVTALAAVGVVAALSVPFALRQGPPAASPVDAVPVDFAATPPILGECQDAPMVNPTTKEVAAEHWPQYVQLVLDLLPARSDYVVQNTYDLCNWGESGISNAYAVINLGHGREHGHLTVNLYVHETAAWVPGSCADLNATAPTADQSVLFCQEAAGSQPLLYGTAYSNTTVTVGAVYPDHRGVVLERNGLEAVSEISIDDLKAVVTDQGLLNLIPTSAVPLPTSAAAPPEAGASAPAKQ